MVFARSFVVCVLLVCVTYACAAGVPDLLVAVYRAQGSRTNCTLVHVNYTSGDLVHVGNVSSACEDFVPTAQGIPRDTLDTRTPGKPAILFASGSGKALHRIDAYSGVDTLVAQLPADYNFTIGVQVVGNSVFYITESQLFRLDGAEWTQIADVAGYGLAAFQPVCTMNGVLYVAGRQGLVTMSQLNKATATVAVVPYNQTLGRVLDLQCEAAAPGGPRLLALANYELYTIDPQSAQVNELIAIPDGDGYPSVAALSVNTFAFADFQHVFTIDTTVPAIVTKQLFDGYFVDGNFFFLPPQ